jgi:hypothetical protein
MLVRLLGALSCDQNEDLGLGLGLGPELGKC